MPRFRRYLSRPVGIALVVAAALACNSPDPADVPMIAIEHVNVVDVDEGIVLEARTVLIAGDRIVGVHASDSAAVPGSASRVEGRGMFLIPGLWDMHVHAHRAGRAAWHYPLYLAHGVTGIRDAGSFADSAMYWRAQWRTDGDAPRVWWGSPPIDGAPKVLSFGEEVTTPDAARAAARRFHQLGFDFLKVYDRLDSTSHAALLDEARTLGIPVEGHVPLGLSPAAVVKAGQRTIEHLTLILESCIPGTLRWVAADSTKDSMTLLADGRLASTLGNYDEAACQALFAQLAEKNVWQVPTLVQMRGAFLASDDTFANDARLSSIPSPVRNEWEAYRRETPAAEFKAGEAVFGRQLKLVGDMHRAGVPLLAATDASDEPWVFPGSSLHDELALFVEAGLTPLEALRTATRNPARYRGEVRPLIADGSPADLVLLSANPLVNIEHVRRVESVILRGRLLTSARQP
jgi:imidazolonepropionase-like amidohydrolase